MKKLVTLITFIMIIIIQFFIPQQFPGLVANYKYENRSFSVMDKLTPQLRGLMNNKLFDFKIIKNWENCTACAMTKDLTYSNSQENDVIIVAGFSICVNSCLFVRTLRATGSKAQVVMLLDEQSYKSIDPISKEELENCGAQVVNCGDFKFTDKRSRCTLKFMLTHLYIRRNIQKMNRVILVDLFDTVFQSDPFNIQVGKANELNVIHEGLKLKKSDRNIGFLKELNYYPTREDLDDYYICSGYIGGTADVLYKITELYFLIMFTDPGVDDQGLLNYFILSGTTKARGLTIAPHRKDELVRHCAVRRMTGDFNNVTGIASKNVRAAVIHHYYRSAKFIRSVLKVCPMKEGQKNYVSDPKPKGWEKTLDKYGLGFLNPYK